MHWCWGFQVGLRRALWWCHRLWSLAVRETGVAFAGVVGGGGETGVAFAGKNGPVLGGWRRAVVLWVSGATASRRALVLWVSSGLYCTNHLDVFPVHSNMLPGDSKMA